MGNYTLKDVEQDVRDFVSEVALCDIDQVVDHLRPKYRAVDIKIASLNLVNRCDLELTDNWQLCYPGKLTVTL